MPDPIGTVEVDNVAIKLPAREVATKEIQPEEKGNQREKRTEEARNVQIEEQRKEDARQEAELERKRARIVNVSV